MAPHWKYRSSRPILNKSRPLCMAKEASTYGRTRDIPGDALVLRLKYKLKRSSKCKYVEYFIFLFVVPALGAKTKMPFHVSHGFHGLAEKYTEQILVLGVCKKKKKSMAFFLICHGIVPRSLGLSQL